LLAVLVQDRPARVVGCDTACHPLERRREEHRLSRIWAAADDAVDGGAESHVEHAIRLIQHQHANRIERERATLEQVLQTSRGGHDQVRSGGPRRLGGEPDAAVHGGGADAPRSGDVANLLDDLNRQLTRGRQHEALGAALASLQALDQRNPKCECLS
jgi:hypothetical protein